MCAMTRQTDLRSIHHVFKFKECHHPHPTPPRPYRSSPLAYLSTLWCPKVATVPGHEGTWHQKQPTKTRGPWPKISFGSWLNPVAFQRALPARPSAAHPILLVNPGAPRDMQSQSWSAAQPSAWVWVPPPTDWKNHGLEDLSKFRCRRADFKNKMVPKEDPSPVLNGVITCYNSRVLFTPITINQAMFFRSYNSIY